MAAPAISGLVADLLQVHPRWTPNQVKGVLTSSGVSGSGALQEPNAVKAILDWRAPLADQGLTPSNLVDAATGSVNLSLGTWNLATWNRATGDLRAGFAGSSYTCKTCAAKTGGTVNSTLATWGMGTWNVAGLN